MVNASRLQINFCRLLGRCEELVAGTNSKSWRLEKYIEALDEQLNDLRKLPKPPETSLMESYKKRVAFLKGTLQADQLECVDEKVIANQSLNPGRGKIDITSNSKCKETDELNTKLAQQIHLQKSAKYAHEMRQELLGKDRSSGDVSADDTNLRQRNAKRDSGTGDLDQVIKYHQNMHDKITEEMVALAGRLKETTLLSGRIIKKDLETVDKSQQIMDKNKTSLGAESERLEKHTQRACSYWLWIMLALVCFAFFSMVVFMKLYPKANHPSTNQSASWF